MNIAISFKRIRDLFLIVILYSYILITNLKINNIIVDEDNKIKISIFILFIIFSLIYIFSKIVSRHFFILDFLIIIYIIYEFFLLFIGNITYIHKENIFPILYFSIMFLAGRFVFSKIVFNEQILETINFILLLIFSSCFIFNKVIGGMIGGVNTIYYQLCILPACIRSKLKIVRYLSIVISTFCVFFSSKRVAFLIWIIIIMSFLFIIFDFKKRSLRNKFFISIFCIIFLFISIFFMDTYMSLKYGISVFGRLVQLVSDGGSGRSELLELFFDELKNNTFLQILFGHNMVSTVTFTDGIGVHNDFIEIFYRCGLFGLILMLGIIKKVIKYILKIKIINYRYYCCFLCEFIMIALFMLFSQIIYITSYNCIFAFEIALLVSINRGEIILNE